MRSPGSASPAVAGGEVIGRALAVWDKKRGDWPKATITAYDAATRRHRIRYKVGAGPGGGGAEATLDLSRTRFQWASKPPPSAQPNPTAADAPEDPHALVGARVKVFWPGMARWYQGKVVGYDAPTRRHIVKYRDGDEQKLQLRHEAVLYQDLPPPPSPATKAGAKRAAAASPGVDEAPGSVKRPKRVRGDEAAEGSKTRPSPTARAPAAPKPRPSPKPAAPSPAKIRVGPGVKAVSPAPPATPVSNKKGRSPAQRERAAAAAGPPARRSQDKTSTTSSAVSSPATSSAGASTTRAHLGVAEGPEALGPRPRDSFDSAGEVGNPGREASTASGGDSGFDSRRPQDPQTKGGSSAERQTSAEAHESALEAESGAARPGRATRGEGLRPLLTAAPRRPVPARAGARVASPREGAASKAAPGPRRPGGPAHGPPGGGGSSPGTPRGSVPWPAGAPGSAAVGARVALLGRESPAAVPSALPPVYRGRLVQYDSYHKRYKLLYDEGGEEWVSLLREPFWVIGPRGSTASDRPDEHGAARDAAAGERQWAALASQGAVNARAPGQDWREAPAWATAVSSVEAPAGERRAPGAPAPGQLLAVRCAGDGLWYRGCVEEFADDAALVVYADGEAEWLDLAGEEVCWGGGRGAEADSVAGRHFAPCPASPVGWRVAVYRPDRRAFVPGTVTSPTAIDGARPPAAALTVAVDGGGEAAVTLLTRDDGSMSYAPGVKWLCPPGISLRRAPSRGEGDSACASPRAGGLGKRPPALSRLGVTAGTAAPGPAHAGQQPRRHGRGAPRVVREVPLGSLVLKTGSAALGTLCALASATMSSSGATPGPGEVTVRVYLAPPLSAGGGKDGASDGPDPHRLDASVVARGNGGALRPPSPFASPAAAVPAIA